MKYLIISAVIALGLFSCETASQSTPTIDTRDHVNVLQTEMARPTETPNPNPVTYEFQGSGDSVEGPFDLGTGLVLIDASHSGRGNFIVRISATESDMASIFSDVRSISKIGSFSGSRAHRVATDNILGLSPGPHRLEIKADGSWTVAVAQELPTAGQLPPITWDGHGDNVFKWLRLSEAGVLVFSANHNGQESFVVSLVSAVGAPDVRLVHTVGPYEQRDLVLVDPDGSHPLIDPVPGLYAIEVLADGDWSLSLEP